MPWDADFQIVDGKFFIYGHVGPSGIGTVSISLPIKEIENYYNLSVIIKDMDLNFIKLYKIFKTFGYELVPAK